MELSTIFKKTAKAFPEAQDIEMSNIIDYFVSLSMIDSLFFWFGNILDRW